MQQGTITVTISLYDSAAAESWLRLLSLSCWLSAAAERAIQRIGSSNRPLLSHLTFPPAAHDPLCVSLTPQY